MALDQVPQPVHRDGRPAQLDLGLRPVLEHRQAAGLETARLLGHPGGVPQVVERRPLPQVQRLTQQAGRARQIAPLGRLPPRTGQRPEAQGVQLALRDAQEVAPAAVHHPLAAVAPGGPDERPGGAHVHLEVLPGGARRIVRPHDIGQHIHRDRGVGPGQQSGQDEALLARTERHLTAVDPGGQRAEEGEAHRTGGSGTDGRSGHRRASGLGGRAAVRAVRTSRSSGRTPPPHIGAPPAFSVRVPDRNRPAPPYRRAVPPYGTPPAPHLPLRPVRPRIRRRTRTAPPGPRAPSC